MIHFAVRGVLLDIEGTTSSISFVYDIMFPFVRRELDHYLEQHWGEPDLTRACNRIAQDAGHESLEAWAKLYRDTVDVAEKVPDPNGRNGPSGASHHWGQTPFPKTQELASRGIAAEQSPAERAGFSSLAFEQKLITTEVIRLMDGDVKATGLKQLQGLVWEHGFSCGELRAHVYEDVPPALERWRSAGIAIRIYSSGSVHAQKLFFGHTTSGNLLPYFSGHDDTTIGAKKEAESYRRIASAFGCPTCELLFLSDIAAELDAAREAGLLTALVIRDTGERCDEAKTSHPVVRSFDQIKLL
jgi:enolase-phosphatase E1